MAYDKNTDYQAEINAEKAKGDKADTAKLASLEASRNEKIAALNASGTNTYGATATNNYTGSSGGNTSKLKTSNEGGGSGSSGGSSSNTDYQALINEEKAKGANADLTKLYEYETARNKKIEEMNAAGTNTYNATVTHNYDNDYQALINAEKAKGSKADASKLATYENYRNEKIAAMNAAGTNTNNLQATYEYTSKPTKTITVYNGGSEIPVTSITANKDGTYTINYESDVYTPTVGDAIEDGSGNYYVYVDDDQNGTGWVYVDPESYEYYTSNYIDNYYNPVTAFDPTQYLEEGQQAALDANDAATEMSVNEIKAQLEEGLPEYDQMSNDAYANWQRSESNQVLANAYNGNTGGIGQKQLSSAEAQYYNAMLEIDLEREKFINDCNLQIAQLEAQGRYEDADIISEWAQTKLQTMEELYEFNRKMALQEDAQAYSQESNDKQFAYTKAKDALEKGILTSDYLEALGLSEDDAKWYTNYIRSQYETSAKQAEATLQQLYKQLNSSSNSSEIKNWYAILANAGVSTEAEARQYLYQMGVTNNSNLNDMVSDYMTYYDDYVAAAAHEKNVSAFKQALTDISKGTAGIDNEYVGDLVMIPGKGSMTWNEMIMLFNEGEIGFTYNTNTNSYNIYAIK